MTPDGKGGSANPILEGKDLFPHVMDAWKTTIEVQEHFNDLQLRVRNFAITFVTAVLGVVGLVLKDTSDPRLAGFLLAIGLLGWVAFYLMDRWWYHRYLVSAVEQGRRIEAWLHSATSTQLFALTGEISSGSPILVSKIRIRYRDRYLLWLVLYSRSYPCDRAVYIRSE